MKSAERRQSERRMFRNLSRFPLHTEEAVWVLSERRNMPCRRLSNITAREAACLDYVAAVIRNHI